MSPQDLLALQGARPFRPFRVVLTDGEKYEIHHPELLWIGARDVVIGITDDPASTLFERHVLADLSYVARTEPLDQAQRPGG
jgi:hypothetical protein